MADDLGDEWWMSGRNAETTVKSIHHNEDSAEEEITNNNSKKRKLSAEHNDSEKKKKKKADDKDLSTNSVKKSKKKKQHDEILEDVMETSIEEKKTKNKDKNKDKKLKNVKEKSGKENSTEVEPHKSSENTSKKQKKKTEDGDAVVALTGSDEDEGTQGSKTKKKKNKRRRVTEALAKKPDMPLVPNDLMSSVTKFYTGELSQVEMDELQLDDKHFTVCNDLTFTLQSYIKSVMPKWKKMIADSSEISKGAPLVIIVCSSGIRTVELIRSLADFKLKDFYIAKLFSKHLKIENQVKFLKTHRTHIGVGTPKRIEELILNGNLSLEQTKYVVLDWSWRDAKQSRMTDKTQLREHVMSLLKTCIIPRVRTDCIKLGLY